MFLSQELLNFFKEVCGGVDSCISSELKFTISISSLGCFLLHFERVTFGSSQLGKSQIYVMDVPKLQLGPSDL